jgi:hypothetical protein
VTTTGLLYDPNNVVVGNAVLWYTPWLTVPKVQVADTVAVFTTTVWEAASWVGAGGTDEGFKINVETSLTDIMIEEQSTPVGETVESRTITIEAALAEDTLETMKLAWNGAAITVVAGPPAKRTMALQDNVNFWTVCLETKNLLGFARRIYIPKVTINGSGDTSFRRAADKRLFPVRVSSICATNQILVTDMQA